MRRTQTGKVSCKKITWKTTQNHSQGKKNPTIQPNKKILTKFSALKTEEMLLYHYRSQSCCELVTAVWPPSVFGWKDLLWLPYPFPRLYSEYENRRHCSPCISFLFHANIAFEKFHRVSFLCMQVWEKVTRVLSWDRSHKDSVSGAVWLWAYLVGGLHGPESLHSSPHSTSFYVLKLLLYPVVGSVFPLP